MSAHETLIRAAECLEGDAATLRECHSYADGHWCLDDQAHVDAKAEHDDRLDIAARLRRLAAGPLP